MSHEHNSEFSYYAPKLYSISDQAIGQRIRQCRQSLHMTQTELAIQLGVSTSYVSFLECGKRPLTHQITLPLIRSLNISYNYLVMGEAAPEIEFGGSICEASSYNERLKLEHLLENCTKAEYEMCFQLCHAYLQTSRSRHPDSTKKLPPIKQPPF